MSDWPKYESHKVVQAAKIVGVLANDDGGGVYGILVRADSAERNEEFWPSTGQMAQEAEAGAYAVLYSDGYKSISPAKAFEEGYTLLTEPADTPAHLRADISTMVEVSACQANEIVRLMAALQNCVDFWPSSLNDDLQQRTVQEAQDLLESFRS